MAIEVKEIVRRYRYNGVTLPDVAGMSPKEIRDLYSAQYPELVSAEIGDTGLLASDLLGQSLVAITVDVYQSVLPEQ